MNRFDNIDCMICHKTFQVVGSRKDKAKYCSRKCYELSKRGSKHTEATKQKMKLHMIGDKNPMKNPDVAKKVSLSRMGELNHTWKGGVAKKKNIRYNREYKKWRLAVLERDNQTCQHCKTNKSLGYKSYMTAHHIKGFGFYPELRYDINNGICLCVKCHAKETSIEMINNFRGKRKVA